MSRKDDYSVDEILKEISQRKKSAEAAEKKADQSERVPSVTVSAEDKRKADEDFNKWLREFTSKVSEKSNTSKQPKPMESTEKFDKKTPAAATHAAPPREIEVSPKAKDFGEHKATQTVKRRRSIDETVASVQPDPYGNRIDNAIYSERFDEHSAKKDSALTRTGVIKKADRLINDKAAESVKEKPDKKPAHSLAPERTGTLKKDEKVVGDKQDAKTLMYSEYIKSKERKKQDTGIIKTIDIKIARQKATVSKSAGPVIDNETDLEKTIVRDVRNSALKRATDYNNDTIEGQTRLEGFEEEIFEEISEEELEQQLENNRKKKIEEFKFKEEYEKSRKPTKELSSSKEKKAYTPHKETPFITDIIDYNSASDTRAIHVELKNLHTRFNMRMIVTALAEIAVAIVGVFGLGIIPDFGLGTGSERAYIIINLAILALMCIFSAKALFKGIQSLIMLKPSGDSLMTAAVIFTFVHGVLAITLGESVSSVNHIYVGAAGFLLLLNAMGKNSMMKRIRRSFGILAGREGNEKNIFSVAEIDSEKEKEEFLRGTPLSSGTVSYNVKTKFGTHFLEGAYGLEPADEIARFTTYIVLGASLVLGIVSYFVSNRDLLTAFGVFTAAVLIASPAANVLSTNAALERADKELAKERGSICSFKAVDKLARTKAVVVGSEQLFPEGTCAIKGMQLFSRMKIEDAMAYTVSVLNETAHPFKTVFESTVTDVKKRIPKASDVSYESNLGISAWIFNRKILLGNAQMMGAHGVEIPEASKYEDYISASSFPMFLAIDGMVSAMFVLEYSADPVVQYELQRLEASEVTLLVRTADSNVNEEFLAELFDLSLSSVKILSIVGGNMYDEKTSEPVRNEALVINRGDPVTFMRSITACSILSGQFKTMKIMQYVAMALGFTVTAIFGILDSASVIGALHIVVYGAVWALIMCIIPKIYKAVPAR